MVTELTQFDKSENEYISRDPCVILHQSHSSYGRKNYRCRFTEISTCDECLLLS